MLLRPVNRMDHLEQPEELLIHTKNCEICGSTKDLKRCGKCKCVSYCCQEHQKQHWSLHKIICGSLGAQSIPLTRKAEARLLRTIVELKSSAEAGDIEATFILGKIYLDGFREEKDEKRALQLFQIAADKGHKDALFYLFRMYYEGLGVPTDEPKAKEYLKQAASGEKGLASAQCQLGLFHRYKTLLKTGPYPEDERLALKWLRLSANQGFPRAQYEMGELYYHGHCGVKMGDSNMEYKWYKLASDQGHPKAQARLAQMYDMGQPPVTRDEQMVFKLYLLSAHQGEAQGICGLGTAYRDGVGVAKDEKLALKYIKQASDLGWMCAHYFLGSAYFHGRLGLKKDQKAAVELWKKASEEGMSKATFEVGHCYLKGTGVAQDGKLAYEWFEEASKTGLPDAFFYMGLLCKDGIGVQKDNNKAIQLFKTAAARGNTNAQMALNQMGCRK